MSLIKIGLNSLALLTYGLGNSVRRGRTIWISQYPTVIFVDRPSALAIEETTGPVSFEEKETEFVTEETTFKDE